MCVIVVVIVTMAVVISSYISKTTADLAQKKSSGSDAGLPYREGDAVPCKCTDVTGDTSVTTVALPLLLTLQ